MLSPLYLPDIEKWTKGSSKAAFLLDFDGTMVHLAIRPDDVIVPIELMDNLKTISQNNNISFAIVTGRALHTLDSLMKGVTTIAIGSHGAEWRKFPGSSIDILAPPIPPPVRQAMNMIAVENDCIFEDKIYTISMHLPFDQMHRDLTLELLTSLPNNADEYVVRRIGRTYELLQKSINKGFGIRHLMQQEGFIGKLPIYIGDDVGTDSTLTVVDDLGGLRLGVSNHAAHEETHNKAYMGIDSVNRIVKVLAQL